MAKHDPTTGVSGPSMPSNPHENGAAGSNGAAQSTTHSIWPRLPSSTAIQICLILGGFCFLAILFPGRLDSADAVQPELRHYVAKVASFLSSNEHPEIVILGSSLMLYPATLCDLEMEGKTPVDKNWYAAIFMPEYQQAKYLEKAIAERAHVSRHITNLAVASSMMSDHCLLLEAIVAADKIPKLIICGIAPRDFIDNNQPDIALTPVHKLLSDIRPELFQSERSSPVETIFNRKLLQIRRAISCLRSGLNSCFCQLTNRPTNDNQAKMVNGVLHLPPSKEKDLVTYNKVYNPVNLKRFEQETVYLERMLQGAKRKKIAVLLVSMPLTQENANLLPAPALDRYNVTIRDISTKYGVKLLDLQRSPVFDSADFIDSCHLNARGGAKFYAQLVNAITDSSLLQAPAQ